MLIIKKESPRLTPSFLFNLRYLFFILLPLIIMACGVVSINLDNVEGEVSYIGSKCRFELPNEKNYEEFYTGYLGRRNNKNFHINLSKYFSKSKGNSLINIEKIKIDWGLNSGLKNNYKIVINTIMLDSLGDRYTFYIEFTGREFGSFEKVSFHKQLKVDMYNALNSLIGRVVKVGLCDIRETGSRR